MSAAAVSSGPTAGQRRGTGSSSVRLRLAGVLLSTAALACAGVVQAQPVAGADAPAPAAPAAAPIQPLPPDVPAAPRPMTAEALAELMARPVGAAVNAPRARGELDLRNRKVTIAEYRVLVEQAAEQLVPVRDGQLMGQPVRGEEALLAHEVQLDHPLIQALVDRAWQDLQARLATAGIELLPNDKVVGEHGAIHAATEPGSTAANPVLTESRTGSTQRRYATYAPTGMRLVKPSPGGLGVGDLVARVAYRTQRIEALSLSLAINLSQLDPTGQRRSGYAPPPGGGTALSPLMELGPAPSASLVYAHNQAAHVTLTEALTLGPEFARLRLAELGEAPPRSTLDKLMDASRELTTGRRRLAAVLEPDGAATARLMGFALSAANQAIVDALAAAR